MVLKDATWNAMIEEMEGVKEELTHSDSRNPCVKIALTRIRSALAYARGKALEWE